MPWALTGRLPRFCGRFPLSEPESRALHALSLRHHFSLTLSYHAQGEAIFWQFLDYHVPQGEQIGQQLPMPAAMRWRIPLQFLFCWVTRIGLFRPS